MSDLGNKEVMAKNINYYMELFDKSRKDMCAALGVKYTTFTDWVNGNTYPRIDKIELMANYFGIEKSDLIESKDLNEKAADRKSRGIKIPVLGRVAAGIPIEAVEDILDYEEITEDMAKTGEHFGLIIAGDSMEPDMRKGDIVVVRQQPDIESGEIAVVLVNGSDATVKKVVKQENGIMLVSINTEYQPKFYTCEQIEELPVQIIGRVMEHRRKY